MKFFRMLYLNVECTAKCEIEMNYNSILLPEYWDGNVSLLFVTSYCDWAQEEEDTLLNYQI